jgi:hypothetical protein
LKPVGPGRDGFIVQPTTFLERFENAPLLPPALNERKGLCQRCQPASLPLEIIKAPASFANPIDISQCCRLSQCSIFLTQEQIYQPELSLYVSPLRKQIGSSGICAESFVPIGRERRRR